MKIVYSPRAIADLRAISAYLKPRSPQGAKRVRAAILDAIAQLALFPRGGFASEGRYALREGAGLFGGAG